MAGLVDRALPLVSRWRRGWRSPPRIVFLHIPKCAGTTVERYFFRNLGHPKHGGSVILSDNAVEDAIESARRAPFVGGHFGWETLDEIREGAFAFTVLRRPFDRLWSTYWYARELLVRKPARAAGYERVGEMSFAEFCACREPQILAATDNVMTRFLGGEDALTNISRLDAVICAERMDEAFPRLLQRLSMPVPRRVRRHNRTGRHRDPTDEDRTAAAPRIERDLPLYERAAELSL